MPGMSVTEEESGRMIKVSPAGDGRLFRPSTPKGSILQELPADFAAGVQPAMHVGVDVAEAHRIRQRCDGVTASRAEDVRVCKSEFSQVPVYIEATRNQTEEKNNNRSIRAGCDVDGYRLVS